MSGTKIFFVLLIVLFIAFVAIEVVGVRKNSEKPPAASGGSSGPQLSCADHAALCGLNSMLDPFSPKLNLSQRTFALTSASPQIRIQVPPDAKNNFRMAAFKFPQNTKCASVHYLSSDEMDSKLHDQTWPQDKDGSGTGNLVILKSGGVLEFHLANLASQCQLVLQ